MSISYRSECPICGVCLTSTLPCWRHPVHSLATLRSSSPRAPHQGRTHIHIPLTLKVTTTDAYGEQGCNLLTWHLWQQWGLYSIRYSAHVVAVFCICWYCFLIDYVIFSSWDDFKRPVGFLCLTCTVCVLCALLSFVCFILCKCK